MTNCSFALICCVALDKPLPLSGLLFAILYTEGIGRDQGCSCVIHPHALTHTLKPYQSPKVHCKLSPICLVTFKESGSVTLASIRISWRIH